MDRSTDRPTGNILKSRGTRYKLKNSEEVKSLLQVCAQETTFGDKKYNDCRLKSMVQRHLEQKSDTWRRGRTCKRSSEQRKSERKRQRQCQHTAPREETILVGPRKATKIGAHSSMNRTRGKGKGRLRSLSPTGSPHRNSKGDGRGSDDGQARGSPKFVGKSPWVNFKKGSCQKGNSCNYWHVPECAKFKSPAGCKCGGKCVYQHTGKPADEKNISATLAIHIPANNERQMQITENSVG